MKGREFLKSGQALLSVGGEHAWRSAAGRAYYALLQEGADALLRWGFPKPRGEQLHIFVRRKFNFNQDPDLKLIGDTLDGLSTLRNQGDYQLAMPGPFATDALSQEALKDATRMIDLLDVIEADPTRKAAAIAALRAARP